MAELFSKKQINNNTGGPQSLEMLFSIDELKNEFEGFEFEYIEECRIDFSEEKHHQGEADVIRVIATKK